MDKSARLNVTIGIDMQIVAATSNTAVYKFRIILKVNCENRLCATVFADAVRVGPRRTAAAEPPAPAPPFRPPAGRSGPRPGGCG